ncbi:MAG TPA: hypothetical protein VGH10_08095 [Actinomycetota bacterium]
MRGRTQPTLRLARAAATAVALLALGLVWAWPAPASAATPSCTTTSPISFGAGATASTIAAPGDTACFQFSGVVGDAIRANVRATSGALQPLTDVFDPSGTSKCATPGDLECDVTAAGTWTIRISDDSGSNIGTFDIYVQRLDDPVGCRPIAFGARPIAGTVAVPGDAACFTFSGSAGDVIFGHAQITTDPVTPVMELNGPTGAQVCVNLTAFFTCTLTGSGTQGLLLYNQATQTGSFHVIVQRLTSPVGCSTLVFGAAPLTKRISSVGAVDCFTFAGALGDTVTVDPQVVSGTISPETDDFDPAGVSRCATPGPLTCVLGSAGRWTTLIWDDELSGTGTFTISAVDLSVSPASGPSATPVSVSASGFAPGESVTVKYRTGLASPATVPICTTLASGAGVAACSGTIPPPSGAGSLGPHAIRALGATSHHTTTGVFTLT